MLRIWIIFLALSFSLRELHGNHLKLHLLTNKSYFHSSATDEAKGEEDQHKNKHHQAGDQLTEKFDLLINYEYKMANVEDNHFMDPRETMFVPPVVNVLVGYVLKVDLGPEGKLAQVINVKVVCTARGPDGAFVWVISVDIYEPNFDKIYELNMGQVGNSKVMLNGTLNFDDKSIRDDEAIVMFVDLPLIDNNGKALSPATNALYPFVPLGCEAYTNSQKVHGWPNFVHHSTPIELNQFYGHHIYGLSVNIFKLKTFINEEKLEDNQVNCAICFASFCSSEQILKFHLNHFFHAICIEKWMSAFGDICPQCKMEIVATKQMKIEPSFCEVNLTLDAFAEIKRIANSKTNGDTNFAKRQAKGLIKKMNEVRRIFLSKMRDFWHNYKLNNEIFSKLSNENLENMTENIQQIMRDPTIGELVKGEQKLLDDINTVIDMVELWPQKTLETLRIVREKTDPNLKQ